MAIPRPKPSSAIEGFFQAYPTVPPQYLSQALKSTSIDSRSEDAVLENILNLYLPQPLPAALDKSIHDFARTCFDPETLRLAVDCETNHPKLQLLTTFGERNDVDPLRTSEGWRGLKDIQTRAGVVAHGYQDVTSESMSIPAYNRRVHQFALAHLWSPSCASVSCPAAMSDGAAVLLARHLNADGHAAHELSSTTQDPIMLQSVLREAYSRLVSFDPSYAWTSGQWMTERPGGSNVSDTETVAHLASSDELKTDIESHGGADRDSTGSALGPYIINGFKWFSSATDADMVVLLAQTEKGLSAFYAPMKRAKVLPSGLRINVMNGVRISRLKNKLGTKGLPTAELEIKGMRAWILGEEGKGVKQISAILNSTRLWTGCGSVGSWSRGLAVARAYAKVRRVKGGLLSENKQHLRWMAAETVKYRACVHLAFLGVSLLGVSELGWEKAARGTRAEKWLPMDKEHSEMLLRVLTPVIKAQCSAWATWGMRECMESLGGVGYCETNEGDGVLNLARLFRDGNVNTIWEGTTNILAEDLVRVVKGKSGVQTLEVLNDMMQHMLEGARVTFAAEVQVVSTRWTALRLWLLESETERLLYDGREALQKMQDVVCAGLLLFDASYADSDLETIIAGRWMASRLGMTLTNKQALALESENDKRIFLGAHGSTGGRNRSKL
ncbi:hypothetical protein H2198_001523 [Neophaeococcomyces mojaviensis]|uniref:Uncharacterized protein n=1 Tax=Neophaeococcomyces mojaviensis TaxID=3383035 RepID=A0ACC3AGT5_9EURO|nr:hypothetical protein H2198_001523 [Knufia sp. JES_112]